MMTSWRMVSFHHHIDVLKEKVIGHPTFHFAFPTSEFRIPTSDLCHLSSAL
ncbi:MAG: hypothetical protein JRF56_21355 [Deltaproteobacteria bacterium]|nr:hypothetical protein [Deltaproteobacteria bacterium]